MINEIFDIIVKSNTFNFIIMMLIIFVVAKKLNLSQALENTKNEIVNKIEYSQSEKNEAQEELSKAKIAFENVETEVAEKIKTAKADSKNLANEILNAAQGKIKQIEDNASRIINAEEKTISARLTAKAAKDSTELAKENIKNLLKENPQLHEKFVIQSIQEL